VDADGSLMIVMTYSEFGNLEQNIARSRPTRWKEILEMMEDTTGHLCVLHAHQWIHNNLHPKNILLMQEAESPMIIDFAYARCVQDGEQVHSTHGRHPYIAPEVPTKGHSTASDVFALGIILWQLVSRVTFPDNALLEKHVHRVEAVPGMLDELWTIIKSCLSYYPAQRPTPEHILAQLTQLHRLHGEEFINDETMAYIDSRAKDCDDYIMSHKIPRESVFSTNLADDGIIHTASVTRSSNEHLDCYLSLVVC
jgi:serine/threonine protein kinase